MDVGLEYSKPNSNPNNRVEWDVTKSDADYEILDLSNANRDTFWFWLREQAFDPTETQFVEIANRRYITYGDVSFAADAEVFLHSRRSRGDNQCVGFNIDSLVFFAKHACNEIYLNYVKSAEAHNKMVIRRGDAQELKSFLLGDKSTVPSNVFRTAIEPQPMQIVPRVNVILERGKSPLMHEYFALVNNGPFCSKSPFLGSFFDRRWYLIFLRDWCKYLHIQFQAIFYEIPVTDVVRSVMQISTCLTHAYVTIKGLPPNLFYGYGFGSSRRLAKFAAARELVKILYFRGLVTPKLYTTLNLNLGATKCLKVKKWWNAELRTCKSNFIGLQKYLEKAGLPKWFLTNGGEVSIEEYLLEKTKIVVENNSKYILSHENKMNSSIRRKRKAVDELEEYDLSTKKNRYVMAIIMEDEEFDDEPREVAPGTSAVIENSSYPCERLRVKKILNIFGRSSSLTVDEKYSDSSSTTAFGQNRNGEGSIIMDEVKHADGGMKDISCMQVLSLDSHSERPDDDDDDDCKIVNEISKNEVEVITLDESDDEKLAENQDSNMKGREFTYVSPSVDSAGQVQFPNRILDPIIDHPKSEMVERMRNGVDMYGGFEAALSDMEHPRVDRDLKQLMNVSVKRLKFL